MYEHQYIRAEISKIQNTPRKLAICTSKIINKLIINQAAAHTIAMGASSNTGLPHAGL
jgi:hypothetical protein